MIEGRQDRVLRTELYCCARRVWRRLPLFLLALAVAASCRRPDVPIVKKATPRDETQATVVTIRTTVQPSNRTSTHMVVIGDGVARGTDEATVWRLYDFKQNTVTFVDEIDRTYRRVPWNQLVNERRAKFAKAADLDGPPSSAAATGATRNLLGIAASQILVRRGAYQREMWFGRHPQIPETLFAMMHVSDSGATVSRDVQQVDAFLTAARGFPLLEHAEVPYGKTKMTVDRVVVSVQRKNVPIDLLRIPPGFRDLATAPAARPQSAASRPPGQTAPAKGSQSSGTVRKTP